MKHRTKQALSWLLSLALMLSLLPGMSLTAYAEASSGTIGNASYTIDDSGVLTVGSGEFTINEWTSVFGGGSPNATAKSIKSVTFESGATLTSDNSMYMFYGWTALRSVDLTNLTASNVTHIGFMFMDSKKLTSVTFGSGFDTSKINNMRQMFRGCSYLTALDLSTFKSYTGNGTRNLYQMFYNCSNLKTIRVSDDWNVENAYGNETFYGCWELVGGNGTKANGSGDYTKAIIDGKDGQKGYFTSASVPVEHRHEFSYSASGSTLTATCSASDCTLTGSKVELTLTPPTKTVYGDSNSAAATLEGREAFNQATGLNIGSSQYYEYYKKGSDTSTSAPTTPGEYTVKVTISGVAGKSYNLAADYTIAQKEVGLTWSDTEFNYDGKSHAPTAAVTGLVDNDQCTVTVTGERTEIGTYTATATGLSNNRYKLPANVEQQFSIVAKIGTAPYVIDNGVLTVKSGSFTGEQWIAAFANSKTTIKSVKFETGSTLTESASKMFMDWSALASVDFSNLAASDVKDMSQMFQGCVSLTELDLSVFGGYTGAGKRSLSQTFSGCSNLVTIRVSDDWNVNNAAGSGTFSDCTKLIGEKGTKCTGTGDYTKAVIDTADQPGYLTSADAVVHWHEFTYSVSADGKTLTATCSVDGCSLTDHQVVLTLKAPEKTVYDDGKSADATLEGKDAFKTATGTSGWNTISYYKEGSSASMAAPTTPGEYTAKVTISNVAGGRYELSVDYSIAQKEIGLTWGETTFHYDGKPHAPTATATGLVGGDKCDVIVTGEKTAIGTYTATASGLSNNRYKLPENNTVAFAIEGWLGTARYTIESSKAPSKSKMLLKATGTDDDSLNDNYKIENGVLTVYSSIGTSKFTLEDWRLAFANDNFIRNYRDNITSVVFLNEGEKSVELTDSAAGMFRDWSKLASVDFSGLDTSSVESMQAMFFGCSSLTELDLSHLGTAKVANMAAMFQGCSSLTKIVVGDQWDTSSVKTSTAMFNGCTVLAGNAGTTYQGLTRNINAGDGSQSLNIDGRYARPDHGRTEQGLFYNNHEHKFAYSVDPNTPWTITATCSEEGCYLDQNKVSISIVKPTLYVYWMDELNKKDGEYDKGASPYATLTMQNVGDQTLKTSTAVADPDGKVNGISVSVSTFTDADIAALDFKALTGVDASAIKYYEKDSGIELGDAPKDAGTYTAKITIGRETASVDYRIYKRFHSPVLKSPQKNANFAFGASEQPLITVEEGAIKKVDDTDTSTFEFALGENATTIPAADKWSKMIPTGSGKGPFYVFYRVAGDKNHGNAMESEFPNKTGYAITDNPEHESNSYKPAYSVIVVSNTAPVPPVAKTLTYNGDDQELVTAGNTEYGKMQYALGERRSEAPTADQGDTNRKGFEGGEDGYHYYYVWRTGDWSDTIPKQTNPGVYYVWYRVVSTADESSIISDPAYVMVSLGKATPTANAPAATATYGQTLKNDMLTNPAGNTEGTWTWVNPGSSVGNVGTNTFRATFTPADKVHYKTVEVDVTVTVGKADPTAVAPTGVTATYGQTLANVTLTNPAGNTPGTWAWADDTQSVGNVVTPVATFKANFTPNDTDNYNSKNDVDVSVQVGKAANPATVNATAEVRTEDKINLASNVNLNGATGAVSYEISGNANGCKLEEGLLTAGNTIGTVTVNVKVAADGNYEALSATPITVTISAQPTQTITAKDVEVAYDETGKSVSASTNGGGAIRYAVKSGSEKYIAVDPSSGALTVIAVPLDGDKAYVIVTAAAVPGSYAETTKEVTVTIKRANTTVTTTPEANELTYNGSAQELVTAGSATVGQLRYALGTETAANGSYSASIPTATNAGDYYVWYYAAVGDNNHNDSTPDKVRVNIGKANATATAPTAKSLSYKASAQDLVVAGSATGGTMKYATGTKTEATSAYSESIPTGTEIGTYYVWYKAGDENHNDTVPAYVTVTIAKAVNLKPVLSETKIVTTSDSIQIHGFYNASPLTKAEYVFSKDGGETWTGAQNGATYTFSGLTAGTTYQLRVRTVETKYTEGVETSDILSVTTPRETIALKEVTIRSSGDTATRVGDSLTAELEPTNATGVTYQWYYGSELIPGATGSSYLLTSADFDKTLTVKVGEKSATSEKVAKAPKATLSAANIKTSATQNTITVSGFTNTPTRRYEYSKNGLEWQDGNVLTGLTQNTSYKVYVRTGSSTLSPDWQEQGVAVSKENVSTLAKPYPFDVAPTVVARNFEYQGYTDGKAPALSIALNDDAATPTFQYRVGASGEWAVWTADAANSLSVGSNYYMRAVIDGNNIYHDYTTEPVTFTVTKSTTDARTAPTAPVVSDNSLVVTIAEADRGKALEYQVDGTADGKWISVPTLNKDGQFTLGALSAGNHTVNLRYRADSNYANPSNSVVSAPFNLTQYSVAYDTNGGSNAPAPQTATSPATITVYAKTDKAHTPTRSGYTFAGWYDAKTGENEVTGTLSESKTLYAHWTANTYSIAFQNGNTTSGTKLNATYDSSVTLKTATELAFTREGYTFAGWATSSNGAVIYTDKQNVKNLTTGTGTVTLYAVWVDSGKKVDGAVISDYPGSVELKLMSGSTQVGGTQVVTLELKESGKYEGDYNFTGVPNGSYNLVAMQVVAKTGETGDYEEALTRTAAVTVSGSGATSKVSFGADDSERIVMPSGDTSSLVEVKEDTPPVIVGGLDTVAENQKVEDRSVNVTMSVESQDKITTDKDTKDAIDAIENLNSVAKTEELSYLNIGIEKEILKDGVIESTEAVTQTPNVITIYIPYDMTGKQTYQIMFYRHHIDENGTASTSALTRDSAPSNTDGHFYVDKAGNMISLYTNQFSTYAIGYNPDAKSPTHGSSSNSGATYAPTVSNPANGVVSLSPTAPKAGDKVTITAKPNEGFEVDTVTVTDANGKAVSVTKVNDTTYTFTQPSGKVKVDVTFKAVSKTDALARFVDVNASDWYADAVRWALDNGVMNGVSPKYFNPNGDTTRAMVVTMLWRMEGSPAYAGASEFTDVDADTWYTEAVRWASTEGIVTGYENPDDAGMIFNPNGAVTREQLATMLYRYAQYKKADVSATASLGNYGDAQTVSSWATSAMQWAVGSGIINGIDGNLVPAGKATRAQVATMLMRYSTSAAK